MNPDYRRWEQGSAHQGLALFSKIQLDGGQSGQKILQGGLPIYTNYQFFNGNNAVK